MKLQLLFISALLLLIPETYSQNTDNQYSNLSDKLLIKDNKLVIGGYGEAHYNQPMNASTYNLGTLDVHRMVILMGYNFTETTQFITEIEFEHVKELYVEQAFLQQKIHRFINLRAGLMLIPMGIINEYHEPTTFNGVERPLIDKYIAPTTWREIGIGVSGNILPASIKYQAYLINGFSSYDDTPLLNGKNGLRKGRQKGAESFINAPNFATKVEYYGIRGLNIGLSGFFGNTQSTLYDGIDKEDKQAIAKADSSIVGIGMLGLDARYSLKGLQLRGQLYYSQLSNTKQYNAFTATDDTANDLGSSMLGYYVEAAYNVLRQAKTEKQLFPFVRYEFFDTHHSVENIVKNAAYKKSAITTGLTFALSKGTVVKTDIQFLKDATSKQFSKTINAGIGVMF